MTIEEMQAHVDELAEQLGCAVFQAPAVAGMMYVEYEPPYIEGPTIRWISDYYTMLHELGHVAHGHTQGRPPFQDKTFYFDNGVLQSEAEAWEWALDNALVEPDTWCRDFMWNTCMGSYYRGSLRDAGRTDCRLWNGGRNHVAFQWDTPTDFFWSIKARMLNISLEEARSSDTVGVVNEEVAA